MSDNVFHDHLDTCEQCRRNPFGLCPEGDRRLHQQATGHDPGPQPPRPPEVNPVDLVLAATGATAEEAQTVSKFLDRMGFGSLFGR